MGCCFSVHHEYGPEPRKERAEIQSGTRLQRGSHCDRYPLFCPSDRSSLRGSCSIFELMTAQSHSLDLQQDVASSNIPPDDNCLLQLDYTVSANTGTDPDSTCARGAWHPLQCPVSRSSAASLSCSANLSTRVALASFSPITSTSLPSRRSLAMTLSSALIAVMSQK